MLAGSIAWASLAGCAEVPQDLVMGGFLLGLPDDGAELTVFLGRGSTPLEVAANTADDAARVTAASDGASIELPYVADGFYIQTAEQDPSLRYAPEAEWQLTAQLDGGRSVQAQLRAPSPATLFGAPLDRTWTVGRELTVSLPLDEADRGFAWVNRPDGEVTWTSEPATTGELLRWLDGETGYEEAVIPGEAFAQPGPHRVFVLAAHDSPPPPGGDLSSRSTLSAGLVSELVLDVQ